jgi:hypothetical protein
MKNETGYFMNFLFIGIIICLLSGAITSGNVWAGGHEPESHAHSKIKSEASGDDADEDIYWPEGLPVVPAPCPRILVKTALTLKDCKNPVVSNGRVVCKHCDVDVGNSMGDWINHLIKPSHLERTTEKALSNIHNGALLCSICRVFVLAGRQEAHIGTLSHQAKLAIAGIQSKSKRCIAGEPSSICSGNDEIVPWPAPRR